MIRQAILEASRKKESAEVFSSSIPGGKMAISTYFYFPKHGKKGYVVVDIEKGHQGGKLVDSKKFTFKSQGDWPGANGSNPSFNKARQDAHMYSRGETNLWTNMDDYDNLSNKERDELRATGNAFWNDDNIKNRRK